MVPEAPEIPLGSPADVYCRAWDKHLRAWDKHLRNSLRMAPQDAGQGAARAEVLSAAARAVLHDRNGSYGEPEQNFAVIAALWSVILRAEVTPVQVALCLGEVKTARLMHNPGHRDSWVDKAGYAACGAEVSRDRA